MGSYGFFIPTAGAEDTGTEDFSLPLRNKTSLRLALLESMNSLHSLATWPVPNFSINAVMLGQWHTLSSNL